MRYQSRNASLFDVEVVFLLASVDLSGIPITRYLFDIEFSLPVYVDEGNMFLKENSLVNQDSRFHSLLIVEAGHPVFVGDPLASRSLSRAFDTVIGQTF